MDKTIDLRVYALVHRAMRQDSQRLVDFVSGTPRDDQSLATVARWYDGYLAVIHHHHTGEDEGVFPDLARRSAKLEDGLGQLEDQHVVLDALLTAMKAGPCRPAADRCRADQVGHHACRQAAAPPPRRAPRRRGGADLPGDLAALQPGGVAGHR
jgi:hypothetical protein